MSQTNAQAFLPASHEQSVRTRGWIGGGTLGREAKNETGKDITGAIAPAYVGVPRRREGTIRSFPSRPRPGSVTRAHSGGGEQNLGLGEDRIQGEVCLAQRQAYGALRWWPLVTEN